MKSVIFSRFMQLVPQPACQAGVCSIVFKCLAVHFLLHQEPYTTKTDNILPMGSIQMQSSEGYAHKASDTVYIGEYLQFYFRVLINCMNVVNVLEMLLLL